MKTGDLIRFRETGILGIITETAAPIRTKVFSTYVDDETGEEVQVNQWFPLDYLLECSEPIDLNLHDEDLLNLHALELPQ